MTAKAATSQGCITHKVRAKDYADLAKRSAHASVLTPVSSSWLSWRCFMALIVLRYLTQASGWHLNTLLCSPMHRPQTYGKSRASHLHELLLAGLTLLHGPLVVLHDLAHTLS